MYHIGQEWRKKHLKVALENKLMVDRAMRDAFVSQVSQSIMDSRQPIAKTIPHHHAFQRKMVAWNYNQWGLYRGDLYHLPKIDHNYAQSGAHGTREWVPWINIHQNTMVIRMKKHQIFMHRVHFRGYGTDPHLKRGKWPHRWNKVFQRDYLQLTRS